MAWTDIDKLEYGKDLRSSAFDNFNKTNLMIDQLNTDITSLEETVSGFDAKISKIDNLTTAVKETGKNLSSNITNFIITNLNPASLTAENTSINATYKLEKTLFYHDKSVPAIFTEMTPQTNTDYIINFIPIILRVVVYEKDLTTTKSTLISSFDIFKNYQYKIDLSNTTSTINRRGSDNNIYIKINYNFFARAIKDLTNLESNFKLDIMFIPISSLNRNVFYNLIKDL